jgi:hypothetical protein
VAAAQANQETSVTARQQKAERSDAADSRQNQAAWFVDGREPLIFVVIRAERWP